MARLLGYSKVSIDIIKEIEDFKRLVPENNMLEDLKDDIKKNGIRVPLVINKKHELIDGYTRLRIAKELGIKEVPVMMFETEGREDELDLLLSTNIKRRALSKAEVISLIEKILEEKRRVKNDIEKSNIENQKIVLPVAQFSPLRRNNSKTEIRKDVVETAKKLGVNVSDLEVRYVDKIKEEASWLLKYIDDKNGIGYRKAYELLQIMKKKNILDKVEKLPESERRELIVTREGQKLLGRDNLLQSIFNGQLSVSQAIDKLKYEEMISRNEQQQRKPLEMPKQKTEKESESRQQTSETPNETKNEDLDKMVKELINVLVTKEYSVEEIKSLFSYLKELFTKGYVKLDWHYFEIARLSSGTFIITHKALVNLKNSKKNGSAYPELEKFIVESGLGFYDTDEGYVIAERLLL
ncbi:MAG: ParB N-terminal domain-containing protein [Saccharolobus sp.]